MFPFVVLAAHRQSHGKGARGGIDLQRIQRCHEWACLNILTLSQSTLAQFRKRVCNTLNCSRLFKHPVALRSNDHRSAIGQSPD